MTDMHAREKRPVFVRGKAVACALGEDLDRIVEAGQSFDLRHAGLKALASLRMEKGYRDYGHDMDNIEESFKWLDAQNKGPSVIIYDTVKGKGVSFMENKNIWHGSPVGDEHLAKALPELKEQLRIWGDE